MSTPTTSGTTTTTTPPSPLYESSTTEGMFDPTVTPSGGNRSLMTSEEAIRYIQYLALTGQLSPLGNRMQVQSLLEQMGLSGLDRRQTRNAMRVTFNLGGLTMPAGGGNPSLAPGLDVGSVRAREGSGPELLSRMGGTDASVFGPDEIWTMPWQRLNQAQFEAVQRMIYDAGFYNPDNPPSWGDRSDPGFREAWFRAVQELYAQGNTVSMDQFLAQKAQTGGPQEEPLQFQSQIIQLTDAASIRQASDEWSQQTLGRKLTDDEKASFVDMIHGLETDSQQSAIDVGTMDQLAQAGVNLGNVTGTITADTVIKTGTALASQYGLAVTSHIRTPAHNAAIGGVRNSDHLTGMAVDISGDESRMASLAAWAHANEGPGKLFRWVGWKDSDPSGAHDDHVHLSFNAYVGEGASVAEGMVSGGTSTGGLEQFMAATRQVESGGNYGVTNSIGAFGAYQFMPGTWQTAARMAGINPNDRSPGAQDAAARALMTSYYERYGDWRLVAAAWHAGEGNADKAKLNFDYLRSIGDSNMSTYDYVQKIMGAFGSPDTGGLPGPSVTSIESVDVPAELEEELRRRFPSEAKAHDVALQFDNFANFAFSGSGGMEP